MEFQQLVLERQACRAYLDKPVEREKLEKIAEIARLTPSACNSQPWKIYVVTGEKAKAVARATQDLGMNKFASQAPAFFVLTEQNATLKPGAERKFSSNHFVPYDVGELAAYITLAAKDLGLETCIIGWVNVKNMQKAVGYPETDACNLVISVGYSDVPLRQKVRKPLEEIVAFIE